MWPLCAGSGMFKVQFENFRCFVDTGEIEIRPITLLVGENSAGKTSFLAGVRQVLESLNRGSPNLFNRDPYFLGGFEQILHRRSRRDTGRSSFTMSIEGSTVAKPGNGQGRNGDRIRNEFTYRHGSPQPELARYRASHKGVTLDLDLIGDQVTAKLLLPQAEHPITIPTRRTPVERASLFRDHPGLLMDYIEFLLMDLRHPGLPLESDRNSEITPSQAKEARVMLHASHAMRATFRRPIFASAPVRTEPRRTYTPSEIAPSSEGSHVPLVLAQAALGNDNSIWQKIRTDLVEFGKLSGLFADINVHRFGKKDIDPFEIMVNVHGISRNLVDVGYGVSQILPIVYQLSDPETYGAYLLQQPEVHLHPRAQAALGSLIVQAVARAKRRPYVLIETHSDYLADRIRIEVGNGRISYEDVAILFFRNGREGATITPMTVNKHGELVGAPEDFRAFFLQEHSRLLGL